MKGTITNIHQNKGMVAVLTETEQYSVFEMLSDTTFGIGDEVSWEELHPQGHANIKNASKGETIEVYFQNHWISQDGLEKQLLY